MYIEWDHDNDAHDVKIEPDINSLLLEKYGFNKALIIEKTNYNIGTSNSVDESVLNEDPLHDVLVSK